MQKLKPEFLFLMFLSFTFTVSINAQTCGIPVLSGVPADLFIDCGDDLPGWPTVTASDLCGVVAVTRKQDVTGSKCGTYVYKRTWTAVGASGSSTAVQYIRFLDETAPTLVVPKDTVVYCGNPLPAPDVISDDNCSWVKTKLEVSVSKHNECEYTMVRTWTATDGCGNSTQRQQTIEVVDTLAPKIEVVNPMLKDIELGEEIAVYDCESPQVYLSDIVVTDCCNDVEVEAYDDLLINGKCNRYGFFRKWRCGYIATDGAGNTSEFYFFMVLYDDEAPVLHNIPEDVTLNCDDTLPGIDLTVEASDNCTRRHIPEFSEEVVYDPADSNNFAVKRLWYFEDDCGNSVLDSQWIFSCDFDQVLVGGDSTMQDSVVGGAVPLTISNTGNSSLTGQILVRNSLVVFPNPTQGATTLRLNVVDRERLQLRVVDKLGRAIINDERVYEKGAFVQPLDLTSLPAGFYSIVLTGKDGSSHTSLIKTE